MLLATGLDNRNRTRDVFEQLFGGVADEKPVEPAVPDRAHDQ
jgi:hypothetical protein